MYKRLKSPLSVQLEVTGKCPQLCQHCYNFWRKSESKLSISSTENVLSPENAKAIIQKLSDMEVFNLVITGGEPLLNMPTTLDCIKFARSKNMGVNMNSTLIPLTLIKAAKLKDAGLSHILTSILGPTSEIHDLVTQRRGSFVSLLKQIKIAQNVGINISANMVLSQLNFGHVMSTAKIVANLGIKNFNVTKAGCPGNCSDFSQLALSQKQVVSFLNDLFLIKGQLGLNVGTLEPIPLCGLYGVKHPELFLSRRCNAGVTSMTISFDGSVRPCSHLDISCGNSFREDLTRIWENMNIWSEGTHLPNKCKNCSLFVQCGGGCRMEAKSKSGGGINQLDPYATPEYVSNVAKQLKKNKIEGEIISSAPSQFRTVKFRLRTESFGGIVALNGNEKVFLDRRGFETISQIKPDQIYKTSELSINWNGLDPNQFLSDLCLRKVIYSI